MSIFTERNHLFARKPSDAGDPLKMAQHFGILLCNIGDYPPEEWINLRDRCRAAGMVVGPWLRTQGEDREFDPQRFLRLLDCADTWDGPPVVNSEKEIDMTGDDITGWMAPQLEEFDAAISSEIRPYASVDWTPLAEFPALPQRFPAEQAVRDTDDEIRRRWHEAGFDCVVVTYGSYHGMQPTDFPRLDPYGVYTADDCQNNFAPWGSAGETTPCKKTAPPPTPEVDMQRIGKQHGIVATHARLRELDPEGSNPAFNPAKPFALPVEQLRAYDRWARTMTILVQDHDARVL